MKYIEAPFPVYDHRFDPNHEMKVKNSVFLAGGITGCPDWQSDIVKMLSDTDLTLLNPRRADFPIGDPDAAFDQIQWEHNALRCRQRTFCSGSHVRRFVRLSYLNLEPGV